MPTSKPAVIPGDGSEGARLPAIECARVSADAMCRAAMDTWHHHERLARLVGHSTVEAEHRHAREVCRLCDEALRELTDGYERSVRKLHPDGDDAEWWHKANGLWHAAREYLRRHAGCDRLVRRPEIGAPEALGSLVVEFDLEASAVLALRQAAEAYRRTRPA